MNALYPVLARINRSSLRERALMFLAGVAGITVLWNQVVMTPLSLRRVVLAQSLDDIRTHSRSLSATNPIDEAAAHYASLKSRELALKDAIAQADEDLASAQNGLIEPTRMVSVLTDVLQRQKGLTLLRLRNLPVQSVLVPGKTDASLDDTGARGADAAARPEASGAPGVAGKPGSAPADSGPYMHPVELVVRGGYLDVLAYLKDLEAQPWGFQWRRFEFVTTEEGAEYRIEFTTLSMASNWLGV